jgi:hypothetical protein
MKKIALYVVVCTLVACGFAGFASAQTTGGTLRGAVTDSQGLAIADASVTITNNDTKVTTPLSTTAAGIYNYPDLPVGNYSITVEKDGFQKVVRSGIQIFANQVTEVNLNLPLGSVTSTIEVTGGTPLVQSGTSQLSNDFSTMQVTELPNTDAGGSPLSLALLAPGTTGQGAGVLGEGGSIGGTRPRMNSFTIDGVDDNRLDITGHSQNVIQDSVAEFNLLTNQFSAEYGHSAGGQFNIITKTGTNQWHGDAWEYNQNRHFNARDNLNKADGLSEPPRFDSNRAGGDLGGPILHDKLFIYGAYQYFWQGYSAQGVGQIAPTAAGLATLQSVTNPGVQAVLKEFPTAPANDAGTLPVTVPGTACAGGCDIPFGNIAPIAPNFYNQKDFIINGDYTQGKHQVGFHVLYDRQRSPNVNFDTPQPQFTGDIAVDARKYLLKDTWIINSRFVNDFRASYSRFLLDYEVPPSFADFPNVEVDGTGLDVGPQGCSPQNNFINTYEVRDTVSYVAGKHTFKFGGSYTRWIAPSLFLPRSRGEWDYSDLNQLANDFAPNGTNGALRNVGTGVFSGNQHGLAGFVQDDWKVTPRLTVNLGLRYEWDSVPAGESLWKLNAISDLPGLGAPLYTGGPSSLIFRAPRSDRNNFAPRLGFAYDPFGDGKWAVRGGFGVSFDKTPQNFPSISLAPQLQTEQNPTLTCSLAGAPAWCANFSPGAYGSGINTGQGFLAGGGDVTTNVPCASQADCRAATSAYDVDIVQPKVLTWSLGVQHQLGQQSSLEVRYVGTRSLELPIQARLGTQSGFTAGLPVIPTYLTDAAVPTTVAAGSPTLLQWDTFENNGGGAATPSGCADPSPYRFGVQGFCGALVTGFPPLARGIYHGVSIDFNHPVGHGLSLRANYTFSKNIDDATNELFSSRVNPRRIQDWQNPKDTQGLSALDVTHKLAISWVYDIPGWNSDNAFARGLTHGWEASGTWVVSTGPPITVLNESDANGNADSAGDRPIFNAAGTVNTGSTAGFVCNDGAGGATRIVASSNVDANGFANCGANDDANVVGYVAEDPTARYVAANLGAKSTVRSNTVRTPATNVWNMGFAKTTKITERLNLQLGFSAYDIFNHRNYALAPLSVFESGVTTVNNALSTTYADPFSSQFLDKTTFSGGSRQMQLQVKLIF